MKTLSILRHAKSSWSDLALPDFERPLAPRGWKAAPLMGRHMRSIGLSPDKVLCSTAVRTRETANLALAEVGARDLPIVYDAAIYEASAPALMERLRRLEPEIDHLLMIGHNPGLQDLILSLTGERLEGPYATIADKLPTGALVVVDLTIDDWSQVGRGCGTVRHFATPRQLEAD